MCVQMVQNLHTIASVQTQHLQIVALVRKNSVHPPDFFHIFAEYAAKSLIVSRYLYRMSELVSAISRFFAIIIRQIWLTKLGLASADLGSFLPLWRKQECS